MSNKDIHETPTPEWELSDNEDPINLKVKSLIRSLVLRP